MGERELERRGASLEHTLTLTLSRGVLLLIVHSKGGRSALRSQGDWHRHRVPLCPVHRKGTMLSVVQILGQNSLGLQCKEC